MSPQETENPVWTSTRAAFAPANSKIQAISESIRRTTSPWARSSPRRFNRRDLLRGSLAVAAISATVGTRALAANEQPAKKAARASFDFKEIEAGVDQTHHVAEGYDAQVLLRWGDPLFPDAPEFDPQKQTPRSRRASSATTPTSSAIIPIDGSSDHGLLVANHEYTNEELMFPGVGIQDAKDANFSKMTKELVDIEIAAHGGAVVEIRRVERRNGRWSRTPSTPAASPPTRRWRSPVPLPATSA